MIYHDCHLKIGLNFSSNGKSDEKMDWQWCKGRQMQDIALVALVGIPKEPICSFGTQFCV